MSGINPVQGSAPIHPSRNLGQAAPKPKADSGSFGQTVFNYINQVDAQQNTSAAAIQNLLAGKTQDILPVVAEVAKADLSFKMLLGVRNKVIEAYKQTMNMQL